MSDQVALDIAEVVPDTGPCAWCGKTTTKKIELEKTRYTTAANGTRVVKKRPVEAWVCEAHDRSLVRVEKDEAGVAIR